MKVAVLNYDFKGLVLLSDYNNNNEKEYKYNCLNNICNKIDGLLMIKKYNTFTNIKYWTNYKWMSIQSGFKLILNKLILNKL